MLNRDVILTEYRADPRNFQRGARIYDQTLEKQHRLTRDRLGRVDARWERSTRNILASRTALSGLAGVAGGAAVIQLRRYAEQWRDVERRLQSIGVTGAAAQQSLVDLAIRTRSSVGGTAAAVQRLAKSTGDGIEITTRRVETLQKLLASGGASGSERASVSLQLGQALQSGVLSGDEFRSIRENAPVEFLDALAKAAGVTRAELKKFAEDQKLTSAIVLEALDNLASTADAKFGALAVSGEEAFTVLTAGLVAYAGKVDETLGATAAVNGAIASLGEYMAGVGEGAETMARAIKVIGVVSLATAGSRRLGALGSAIQKTTVALRADVAATRQQLAASRELLAQRRLEKVAADERLRVAQADIRQRALQGNVTKASRLELERATRAHTKAVNALTGAQTRALASTRALTAAQKAAAVTTRAWTATMRVASGVMAFFGGPVGLAITGLTLFVSLVATAKSPVERLDSALSSLQGVSDQAMQSMDRYAEASKRAGEEQERLGGKIGDASQAMLAQSRIEMQDALRKLEEEQRTLLNDVRGVGILNNSEITGPLGMLEGELYRLYTQYGGDNVFLSSAIQGLKDLQAGTADLQQLSVALNDVRAVGEEAFAAHSAYTSAVADNSGVEAARRSLLSYAQAAGVFKTYVEAINQAEGPFQLRQAYKNLAIAVFDSASASRLLGNEFVVAIADIVKSGALAELQMQYFRAVLAGNSEEAAILREQILAATGAAVKLALTPTPDYSGAGKSAAALAEQLGISLNLAQRLANALPKGVGDNIVFDPRDPRYNPEAARLGRIAAGMEEVSRNAGRVSVFDPSRVGSARTPRRTGGGGGSASSADRDAERNLAAARELLVENGQKALYIEQELNAERERLRELLPALIEMGLARADAEAVLNAELERTEDRLNRVQTASERAAEAFAKGVLQDIRAAEDLNDALDKISKRLLDLAFDRAFDLLAEQFARIGEGTGQGGGFLGNIFSGLFGGGVEAATGGLVHGPGTSTSDSIPAWLSDGEFVIRAASVTPETLPMLDAINRGAVVPRFAGGGQVGRGASSATAGALVNVTIHNHVSNARIETKPSQDGRGLDVMVHDVVNDGILGGKYSKSLGQKFGNYIPKSQNRFLGKPMLYFKNHRIGMI